MDSRAETFCHAPPASHLLPSPLCLQVLITGNGNKQAEMVTDEGAIYVTSNGGYNWKAAVEETVSATLNRYTR